MIFNFLSIKKIVNQYQIANYWSEQAQYTFNSNDLKQIIKKKFKKAGTWKRGYPSRTYHIKRKQHTEFDALLMLSIQYYQQQYFKVSYIFCRYNNIMLDQVYDIFFLSWYFLCIHVFTCLYNESIAYCTYISYMLHFSFISIIWSIKYKAGNVSPYVFYFIKIRRKHGKMKNGNTICSLTKSIMHWRRLLYDVWCAFLFGYICNIFACFVVQIFISLFPKINYYNHFRFVFCINMWDVKL